MKANELGKSILSTISTLKEEIKQKKEILNNLYVNDLSMFGRPDVVVGKVINQEAFYDVADNNILITKLKVNDYYPDGGSLLIQYYYLREDISGNDKEFFDKEEYDYLWLYV